MRSVTFGSVTPTGWGPGARQGGVRVVGRGQGGRPTTLNFRPRAVTILNSGHVLIFYQVIPVNKQGSIESPPRKQRLENDYAKEREKQTLIAKKHV